MLLAPDKLRSKDTRMLRQFALSGLPMITEDEATDDVARVYTEVKHDFQLPFIPNIIKTLAVSPAALTIHWNLIRGLFQHTTLPQSLMAMILFTIAKSSHCEYCSANHELTCRTLGVDEETLNALVEDLSHVSPQRLRVIVEFALKVSHHPQSLTAEDYERVRAEGVADEELVEIILIAALGSYLDILADALKSEVDAQVVQALGR
jgi:uncharacterized peroxidase-related enzyme